MAEVKLYGAWFSPFVKRVEMALKLKGVEYEYIEEDLANKSPLLLELNPVTTKVPVLVHNGTPIAESLVILEYINEAWPGPSLLPKDPYQRAQARFWAEFLDGKFPETTWKACFSKGEEREKAKKDITEALKFLEDEIKGKKFFGGDTIGFVDLTANFLAHWIPIMQDLVGLQLWTEAEFPNLTKWAHGYCNDSFVKEHLSDKDKLVDFFRAFVATGVKYQPKND